VASPPLRAAGPTIEQVEELISSDALRNDVRFQVKLRGYDQVEVDELLDRVADTVDRLHAQVKAAIERAERAEQALADGAATDEALRRTLVLAQRVADEALHQANVDALRIRGEAEAAVEQMARDAERRAALEAEEAQQRLRKDVAGLERARRDLRADVDALEDYLLSERDRLRALLLQQLERLDQLGEVALASAPRMHEVELPEPLPPDEEQEPVSLDYDDGDGAVDLEDDIEEAGPSRFDTEAEAAGALAEATEARDVADEDEDEEASGAAAPRPAVDDDDPYFRELRRALSDDEELGPREHVPGEAEDHDLGLPDRFRWGLRRRR
jgi:DivIVA domain-containing protein